MASLCRILSCVIQPKTIFGLQLLGQLREMFLISDVFQRDQTMGIQRYISTEASLLKQILRNEIYADISVMVASRKHVRNLFRLDVV